MHTRWLRAIVLLALTVGYVYPQTTRPTPRHPRVEETRVEFLRVCEQLRDSSNPFFGDAHVRDLENRLAQPENRGRPAVPLLGQLGLRQLALGRLDEAAATFERAMRLTEMLSIGEPMASRLAHDLALVRLQQGEDANCVDHHAVGSCIVPFTDAARHRDPTFTRQAGALFERYLAARPNDISARWLLNLSRMLSDDFPHDVPATFRLPEDAFSATGTLSRFTDVGSAVGLHTPDLSGGGIMDDFDGDGLLDLVSSTWDPCDSAKAFRNDGSGGFEDVTAAWGLDGQLGGLNLVHGDYDGDGDPDLLILRGGWMGGDGRIRNSLLRNDLGREAGRFVDVTVLAGIAYPAYPTQTAAWADIEGDGDLDLYVGNEGDGEQIYSSSEATAIGASYPSNLFRNNGDGTFTDVAKQAGVTNLRFAKGVAWGDPDGDGDPDLYVSNIGENRLYRNDGVGSDGIARFVDVARQAGVHRPATRSFATWFFDADNDGDEDLFVADYSASIHAVQESYFQSTPERRSAVPGHPVLYRNDGGNKPGVLRFSDVSQTVGLVRPSLPMGANFGDIDGDGWLDIYLGTGVPDLTGLMPNVLLRNELGADPARFTDVTFDAGLGHLQKGHGVAFGDFDNDGDQDVFEQMGGAYPYDAYANVLYQNPGRPQTRWVVLRFVGRRANRMGLGARVRLDLACPDGPRTLHRTVSTGGSFGGSSLQLEVGVGACTVLERLTVRWPGSGTIQRFDGPRLDRAYQVDEDRATLTPIDYRTVPFTTPISRTDHTTRRPTSADAGADPAIRPSSHGGGR